MIFNKNKKRIEELEKKFIKLSTEVFVHENHLRNNDALAGNLAICCGCGHLVSGSCIETKIITVSGYAHPESLCMTCRGLSPSLRAKTIFEMK